eukprot:TRINITY_DN12102_c0_g1_i1.p1 TRINITY_DN12102_c0_g1~~TRINITY_DN12102_c0_g1_i1.p1  ORF type:complete len:74 (-),score=6.83 TRINITY_DN12102_c0_g1_i1:29-250(-)
MCKHGGGFTMNELQCGVTISAVGSWYPIGSFVASPLTNTVFHHIHHLVEIIREKAKQSASVAKIESLDFFWWK